MAQAEARPPDHSAPSADTVQNLESLYRSQYPGLVRLAHLLTGSNSVAEEIVQDAFEQLQKRWQSIATPKPYLRKMVVNRARGHHRRRAIERKHAPAPAPPVQPQEVDEVWPLIQRLSAKQRAVLVLRFYEDLPVGEISDVLGMRPGTVKSTLHRTLRTLEEKLNDYRI